MKPTLRITAASMRQFRSDIARLSGRDARLAATFALNDTAADVLAHVRKQTAEKFDRPTPFALNAFTIRGARPNRLVAVVAERPSVGRKHFLKVQEAGGARPRTGTEHALQTRLNYSGIIDYVASASGARLDAYGNWSSGERNQALSAVQAQRDEKQNTTAASRKRNKRRAGYFVPRTNSKLTPGIWRRDLDGSVTKVLHFLSSAPRYQAVFGFYDGVEEVYLDRLPVHLTRTLSKMIARRGG